MSWKFLPGFILSFLYGSMSHAIQYLTRPGVNYCRSFNKIIWDTLRFRFTNSAEKFIADNHFQYVQQWEILNRAEMVSFETYFVPAQITKLNSVLLTPVPMSKFRDILECLEFNGRSRLTEEGVIPMLNCKPRCYRDKSDDFFHVRLTHGLQSSRSCRQQFSAIWEQKILQKKVKTFLTSICQHNEFHNSVCKNCNLNQRSYRNNGYR